MQDFIYKMEIFNYRDLYYRFYNFIVIYLIKCLKIYINEIVLKSQVC